MIPGVNIKMFRDKYDLAIAGDAEAVRRELHSHPEALNQPDRVSDIVIGHHIENHTNNMNMAVSEEDPPALCSMLW
jgi:hypothetical protein